MPFPYVFTFYSYKGGVGRSMALLNVGYTLASHGRHVLMVDMDLEAPGISSFLHRNRELAPPVGTPLDILPLLHEAIRLGREADPTDATVEQLAPVSSYIHSVAPEKLEALKPKMGSLGRLDLVGADLNRDFNSRLAMLPLKFLRHEELIRVSRLLRLYFKAQRFPHRPLGVEDFEPPISTPYDYVLVDSRTGITEIGGLCIGPMADRLVVVTGLNDQNVNGTLEFLKEAGIETRARVPGGEPWDSADPVSQPEHPSLGPKPTIVVASPVPTGEIGYKQKRLGELERLLGVKPVSLSYHPQMALMESIFVRDYPEEYLTGDYGRLVSRVVSQVGDSAEQLAAEATRLATEGKDAEGAIKRALRLAPEVPQLAEVLLAQFGGDLKADSPLKLRLYAHMAQVPAHRPVAFSNWGNALSDQAKQESGAEADGLFERASAKYAEAVRLKPDYAEALFKWGNALSVQARQKSGAEADGLFEQALAKYADAVRFKPDSAQAFCNWGNALSERANQKSGSEADGLFEQASAKYSEAVRLKPDLAEAFSNWGNALSEQAKQKGGAEAVGLFEQASTKYSEAVRLKPDFAEAFYGWGNALSLRAQRKSRAAAEGLFAQASAKYAEAVRLKPDFADALSNWGASLSYQAKQNFGPAADVLFEQAVAKYAEASRLKPDKAETLCGWGAALSDQAIQTPGPAGRELFERAFAKYAAAVRLKPDYTLAFSNWGAALSYQARQKTGAESNEIYALARPKLAAAGPEGLYNLACLEALLGNTEAAIKHLKAALAAGNRLSLAQLVAEKDFDPIRTHPEFQKFLATLPEA